MYVCGECGQRYDHGGYCAVEGAALAASTDPLLGTEIGRYRLARLLGEGGMGQVYLGVQPAIGSRVAIKILSDQCARMPELLDRFFAEARAVNLIKHECIVSVIDLARIADGRPYIVMEFIEGQTLGQLLRAGRGAVPAVPLVPSVPLGGLVQVVEEVLSALAAAHAIGIVHRDLKPDNVLVTAEGHAKVLDFGIAKLAPGLSNVDSPRTQTGALLGTPAYMAPEQIRGSTQIDGRTDLYAVGVLLFEATTGDRPFKGATLFDLMKEHLDKDPPAPRSLRPDLPVAFEQVILTALAKDPAQRFQTAAAMAHALRQASQELPPEEWRALSVGGRKLTTRAPIAAMPHAAMPHAAMPAARATPVPSPVAPKPSVRPRLLVAVALAVAAIAGGVTLIARGLGGAPETAASPWKGTESMFVVDTPAAGVATRRVDYDPKRFDPVAYLPRAQQLARTLAPDAELTSFEFDPVFADGHVDLTMDGRDHAYEFRSPSRSALGAGKPKNVPQVRACRISIDVGATEVTATVLTSDTCDAKLVRAPHCSLASVWTQARAKGVPDDVVARIGWLFDETWFFDIDLAGRGGGVSSFQDVCP